MDKKKYKYLGLLGFLGLNTFKYFFTKNPVDLLSVGYLGFFSYFIIAKISGDIEDERYIENENKAKSYAFDTGIALLALVMFLSALLNLKTYAILFLLYLSFALMLLVFALRLYRLEESE